MPRRTGSVNADRAPLLGIAVAALAIGAVALWNLASPPPLSWLGRDRLPSCPAIVVEQGQAPPQESSCLFSDSATEAGAELRVTSLTSEGDPIRTYYRRIPGQPGLDVVIDASDDAFAGLTWERQTCPRAAALDDLGPCTSS